MNYRLEVDLFYGMYRKIKNLLIPSKTNNYAPDILKGKFLFYFLSIILLVQIFSVISLSFPLSRNFFFADVTKVTLLDLLNASRQQLGLKPLQGNEKLDQAAMLKAQDMVKNNYFSHQSPQGISPWFWFSQVGYNYTYAGENLAVGFLDSTSVYDAWSNSPSHRVNLLNPNYKEVGTAIVSGFGSNNAILIVQFFGSPLASFSNNPIAKKSQQTALNQVKPVQNTVKTQTPAPSSIIPSLTPTPVPIQEKVLAESSTTKATENVYYPEVLGLNKNFIFILKQAQFLQYIFYGMFSLTAFYLCLHMIMNFKKHDKKLVFRSLLGILMIGISILLNFALIGKIPTQII